MYFSQLNCKKGFTLVELLVVITVIGILSAIALVGFGQIQKSARDSQRTAIGRNLLAAIQCYELDTGRLPDGIGPTSMIKWGALNAAQPNGFGRCYPRSSIIDPYAATVVDENGKVNNTTAFNPVLPLDPRVSYGLALVGESYAIEIHGETKNITLQGRE